MSCLGCCALPDQTLVRSCSKFAGIRCFFVYGFALGLTGPSATLVKFINVTNGIFTTKQSNEHRMHLNASSAGENGLKPSLYLPLCQVIYICCPVHSEFAYIDTYLALDSRAQDLAVHGKSDEKKNPVARGN